MPLVAVDDPAVYRNAEVQFAMRDSDDGSREPVMITVTLGALDGLAPSHLTGRQLAEWVDRHRREFEAIAIAKHEQGQTLRLTINDWIARFPMPT